MVSIGEKIKKARQDEGLTQAQLSKLVNRSINTISRWETDKRIPNLEELNLLAEVLDIDFLCFEKNEEGHENNQDNISTRNLEMILEDLRLDLKEAENQKKKYQIIIFTVVLVAILLILTFVLIINWRSPKDSQDTIKIEYYE